ncbi:MAG: 16S rRNA (uracil(1498)-N(3))-methyltransferase [Proteobacteria bacterium]|nr:16S rRNA (uracil(1498)-N(3))-methyltransferase [Pseudomonadota bacterium]
MKASGSARPRARLFVVEDLRPGAALALTRAQAHYLGSVLRLASGAPVLLFNGRDGEWRARIAALARGAGSLAVEAETRRQESEPDLWLLFAPVKRAPIDLIAAKATELGASALLPVETRRTVVERVNLARLRANAVEAAEQSERLSVPELRAPAPLGQVLALWPEGRRLLLLDERGGAPPIAEALRAAAPGPWAVLVGPEGGFERSELDALGRLPFVTPVGMGPRILRAETAALAALACWQALLGDWRMRPPARPPEPAVKAPWPQPR